MTREEAIKKLMGYSHTPEERAALETLIPELHESEDEKIRKGLIKLMTVAGEAYLVSSTGIKKDSYLAYLEKQKEQKPAEWNDADMREARQNLIVCCRDWERGENTTLLPIVATRARYFLEHLVEPQKPAEWSEEDKRAIDRACVALRAYANGELPEFLPSELIGYADRLQSIRPSWKPGKWDMSMLLAVLNDPNNAGAESCQMALKSLYEQLQKL